MKMPALLGAADRQHLFVFLLAVGALQAVLSVAGAFAMSTFLTAPNQQASLIAGTCLLIAALAALLTRAYGRALCERFGQSYVAVCRVRLLKAIVRNGGDSGRHGIAMTRMITDLSSIKNWVGQGIAAGATNLVLVIGLYVGAALLLPAALGGLIAASVVLLIMALVIARPLQTSIRAARSARGKLAARVGEALLVAPCLRNFAGLDQEKRRLYRIADMLSERLAIRYWRASLLRNSPELGFVLGAAVLGFIELQSGQPSVSSTASSVLLLAAMTTAQRGLLEALDLRFSFDEGNRRLSEAISAAGPQAHPWQSGGPLGIRLRHLRLSSSGKSSSLVIEPGQRVTIEASNQACLLFHAIAGLRVPASGRVHLFSPESESQNATRCNLAALLVAPDVPLRRGTIESNLRAAAASATPDRLLEVARLCDLWSADEDPAACLAHPVAEAGRGLGASISARIRLARAVLGRPGVLLVDDPIFAADAAARNALKRVVEAEDVTILATSYGKTQPFKASASLRFARHRFRLNTDPNGKRTMQVAA